MNNIGGVFYFYFSFEDEEDDDGHCSGNTWAFNLTNDALSILGEKFTEEDWFCQLAGKLEGEYGVHDWSTSPCDNLVSIGYNTYEVERDMAPVCVEDWRQEFIKRVGADNVTGLFDLGAEENYADDLAVFNQVKELASK